MNISSGTYFPSLDGLRSFGVLGVLFYHVYDIRPEKEHYLQGLYVAVEKFRDLPIYFFFILSGYLITLILLKLRHRNHAYIQFYLSRFLRVLPLYYFVLFLVYLILPAVSIQNSTPFADQLFYWIPVANSAMAFNMQIGGPEHFWTLCIEIQFYLLIPVLLLSLSRKNIFRILLLLALISLLSKILFIQFHLNAYYSSLCRMDVVVLGCLAALHPYSANKKQYQAAIFGYSLLLAGLYLAFNQTTLNWSIRLSVISLGCLVTLFYVNNNQNIITRFLGLPIFEKIAKAGYSTYAFHPFCIYLYYKYLGQHHYIADLLFCILISVAVGFTGYRVIEFPLNNVRKRLLKNYTG